MSKINVKFLTDEALATIKANLDKFTKIVKENPSDSSSFIAELPEECFVEKKYPIEDFELEVDGDGDYSKVDVDNAITLYEHLCCLPKHVLGDERFWMWLILEKCYAATIQAMPMESGKKIIADHWLFGQGRRRGLMFGALSRAYYRVQLTKDDTLEDAYELTKFATQNYMRYREFTWRGYSNNKTIVTGAQKGEKKAIAKYGDTIETIKDYYPSIAKHISQLGSVMLLDFMREDYILDSVLDFCDSLAEANNIMPIKQVVVSKMYFYSISPFFAKVMSSSGNVWAVNRIQHICNTTIHKSHIYGLFKLSKRSQRDNYKEYQKNIKTLGNPVFSRFFLCLYLEKENI